MQKRKRGGASLARLILITYINAYIRARRNQGASPYLTLPYLTSPHLTSPHLTSHLTSPHLTSPHLTSSHLTSPHLTSPISNFLKGLCSFLKKKKIKQCFLYAYLCCAADSLLLHVCILVLCCVCQKRINGGVFETRCG